MMRRFSWISPFVFLMTILTARYLGVAGAGPSPKGEVVGIAFDDRQVSNLDQAIEYYKAIGFEVEEPVKPKWRADTAENRLFDTEGAKSRTVTMKIDSSFCYKQFTLRLREYSGVGQRQRLNDLKPWDPGSSHIGLAVRDADAVWSRLRSAGLLRPVTEGGSVKRFPGMIPYGVAYMTDPDGMDVEIIGMGPTSGTATTPETLRPGFSHIGLVILDSAKAKLFYGESLGIELPDPSSSPWIRDDGISAVAGSKGTTLRFFQGAIRVAYAPDTKMRYELVEYKDKDPDRQGIEKYRFSDIGVNAIGIQVRGLDAFYDTLKAKDVQIWSKGGIVKLRNGSRAVVVRDPDTYSFVEFFEKSRGTDFDHSLP
jgi:catechol 2,3-dioxygenase-like lactoylglutathione lyase family enzyme